MADQSQTNDQMIFADVKIDADTAQIWEVLADYCGMYTWAPGIENTESVSDAKQGVGAIRRNTATGFGPIDQTVTKWNDGEGFTYFGGAFGPFSQTLTTYQIHQTGGDGCRCSLQISYELQDAAMAGSPGEAQLKAKLQSGLHDILGALKTRVETGNLVRPHKSAN